MDTKAIQREFESGFADLDPEGALGLAAIQACAEVFRQVRALTPENADATRAALTRLQQELKPLDQAVASGRFDAALPVAMGRVLDMLNGALGGLEA